MFPYLFLFFLASFSYFNNKESRTRTLFFLISMILISGLRDMIGGYDVYIYAEIYEEIDRHEYDKFEKGFMYYFKMLYSINIKREFMFFITALLLLSSHYFILLRLSVKPNMTLYIYFCKFFLFTFVYLRQGLAMSFAWLAIYFLLKEKKLYSFLLLICAFYFHKSALILLPFLFVYNRKYSYFQMIFAFIIFATIALSPIGSLLTSYFADNVDNKYQGYSSEFNQVNILYVIESGILIYLLFKFRYYFFNIKNGIIIYNGMFVFICIQIVGLTNATFTRLGWYYLLFLLLFFPYIYNAIKDVKLKNNFKFLVYVYFALVFFRLLFVYDGGDFMPFKFIFEDFDRPTMWKFMEYRR